MGMIGKWIDTKCQAHPDVMRRVLGRKFGSLSLFLTGDDKCGCLIGSWGIESGEPWACGRPSHSPFGDTEEHAVGMRVYMMTCMYSPAMGDFIGIEKRPDAFVIRLLKQRIRKALGLAPAPRETAVENLHVVSR